MLQLQDGSAPARAPQARRRAARKRGVGALARIVQVMGELLITAGAILLLFIAWQLWWTNVESDAKQRDAIKDFAQT